ncbi:unnamed protein product, partial [Auanema sp. JU1783]
DLNTFANSFGLVVPERLTILPILLRTPASKNAYKALDPDLQRCGPWNEVLEKLAEKLCPKYSQEAALIDLQNTVQGDLSIEAFAHVLERKAYEAFGYNNPHRDQTLKTTFIRGLKPSLKRIVMRARPTDLNEAIEIAKEEQSIINQTTEDEDRLINAVNRILGPYAPRDQSPQPPPRRRFSNYQDDGNYRGPTSSGPSQPPRRVHWNQRSFREPNNPPR